MKPTSRAQAGTAPWGIDRGLALLIGGVVALIVAGLVAVPLLGNRTPTLAPETSPDGVVQRFFLAAYDGDWDAAHSYLSASTREKLSVTQLQQAMRYTTENSQVRTGAATERDTNAVVNVTQTTFTEGGLFGGSGEYNSDFDVFLIREGDAWKIVSGPFPLPEN